MTVGMIVPDLVNPIFTQLLGGAEDILSEAGYAVLFGSSENRSEKERRYLETFRERQVDGVIVNVATGTDGEELLVMRASVPTVLVDRLTTAWPGDSVRSDDEHGMGLAVDHLVALGHRRIALVNGEMGVSGAARRKSGFEHRLGHHGLEPVWESSGTFTIKSGREQATALLASEANATAICAGNDVLAMGVMAALHEEGLAVPSSVSVTGYDDIEFATIVSPALTTVTQPMRAMGAAAARLVRQRMEGPDEPPHAVMLSGKLVVRGSTGPAPE
jgi:LacI family transcriptional regulator